MSRYWPLVELRLTTRRLVLRPCTEGDLDHLADVLPDDYETDPNTPRHDVGDLRIRRGMSLLQAYWSAMATWSPERWRLPFVVETGGRAVGVQELEAEGFARRRVVETGSWLVTGVRGTGMAKEMRAAVLHLAFGRLGAAVAETEAWWDNGGSLGVSRALGYEPNGETVHVHGDRRDRMVRMRLTAERWRERAGAWPTAVDGLDGCWHLFGAGGADRPPGGG